MNVLMKVASSSSGTAGWGGWGGYTRWSPHVVYTSKKKHIMRRIADGCIGFLLPCGNLSAALEPPLPLPPPPPTPPLSLLEVTATVGAPPFCVSLRFQLFFCSVLGPQTWVCGAGLRLGGAWLHACTAATNEQLLMVPRSPPRVLSLRPSELIRQD